MRHCRLWCSNWLLSRAPAKLEPFAAFATWTSFEHGKRQSVAQHVSFQLHTSKALGRTVQWLLSSCFQMLPASFCYTATLLHLADLRSYTQNHIATRLHKFDCRFINIASGRWLLLLGGILVTGIVLGLPGPVPACASVSLGIIQMKSIWIVFLKFVETRFQCCSMVHCNMIYDTLAKSLTTQAAIDKWPSFAFCGKQQRILKTKQLHNAAQD